MFNKKLKQQHKDEMEILFYELKDLEELVGSRDAIMLDAGSLNVVYDPRDRSYSAVRRMIVRIQESITMENKKA